jgi:hypothetical protein
MDGDGNSKLPEGQLLYRQDMISFCRQHQNRHVWEEKEGKPHPDPSRFNLNEHLAFSPPKWTRTPADMEINNTAGTTPFAVSGNFSLFSTKAIDMMHNDLLTDEAWPTFQKSNSIGSCQSTGIVLKYVKLSTNTATSRFTISLTRF